MNNYNNMADTDLSRTFTAFADLDQEVLPSDIQDNEEPVSFGEFADDSAVFPMI